jgi:hypothetical protein
MMKGLTQLLFTAEALVGLMLYDLISLMAFKRVHTLVKNCPVLKRQVSDDLSQRICDALAEACVWYVKRVYCLQRSAVVTWLLRLHGVPAELVIGCRPIPVQSHAWVEVHGSVINDRPQYQKFFVVMERF